MCTIACSLRAWWYGSRSRCWWSAWPSPDDVAVPEDPQAAGEEAAPLAVALDLLGGQEAHQRLGHRQPLGHASISSPTSSFSSSSVGMSSAQASREATSAPAALASRSARSGSQPLTSPYASAPPKASPAPSPFSDLEPHRLELDQPVLRARQHPVGPRLTIASSTPSSSSAAAASCGSRVPTATATSAWLPTATVACRSAARAQRPASSAVGPEHRPVVEVVDGDRALVALWRASSASSVAARLGSCERPVPVVQKSRAARIASRSSSSRSSFRSGAFGSR